MFRGSFDRAAAQAVAGVAVTTLSTLMDKSLLQRQGVGRYRIHELVRQFSAERSTSGTTEESIDDRHAAHFLSFAEQAEQELIGARQAVWLESLRRDLDNLRAALTWFLRQGEIERALRLAAALRMFWYHWGYWTEGQHWLEEGLARADGAAPEIRATALHALGMLVEQQSQTERAMRLLDQSLALFRELGDSLGSLRVLNTLGGVASRQGHYHESAAYYQQALDFYRQLGDRERGAVVLHNLAKATRFQGRFGLARERYEEALALHRELGHAEGAAVTLLDLGSLSLDEDRFVEAESRLEESLGASRELGLQPWIAYACWQLGRLHRKQEQLDRARTYLVESMTLARSLGDAFLGLNLLGEIANLAVATCDTEWAVTLRSAEMALQVQLGILLPPMYRVEDEETMAQARAVLNEETFAGAWKRGQGMSLEEAGARALDQKAHPQPSGALDLARE